MGDTCVPRSNRVELSKAGSEVKSGEVTLWLCAESLRSRPSPWRT